jgi:hypothetical protein
MLALSDIKQHDEPDWRRGRVAEGTSLLRMHTAYTCIVGSNPTVSAKMQRKKPPQGGFFRFCIGIGIGIVLASHPPCRSRQR